MLSRTVPEGAGKGMLGGFTDLCTGAATGAINGEDSEFRA